MKPKRGDEKAKNKQLTRSFINSGCLVILAPSLVGGLASFFVVTLVMWFTYTNEPFYPFLILGILIVSIPMSSFFNILPYIIIYEIRTRFTNRKDPIDIPSLVISASIIAICNLLFLSLIG